jgi:hypothetical protein
MRNRLTVPLYGVDNQFSGKMIGAATGRTTGGAPINLDETTYDEVYGRMAMFKVGGRLRVTPRTEAVLNFVYSRSAAEDEATQIGTAGTNPQVPLNVKFTECPVPGALRADNGGSSRACDSPRLSAGSPASTATRTSAARSSACRPASHRASLRRTASSSERSWAFSLGPTGGVLIGVGPFEVMAETQLRFLGGAVGC